MIPISEVELREDFAEYVEATKTYKIDTDKGIIRGRCDGVEALKQAIYKIINTERYEYLIYSWNYGCEFKELFGMPSSQIYPEIKRRIEDGLSSDKRIESVEDFSFEKNKGALAIKFKVISTEGEFYSEVNINV